MQSRIQNVNLLSEKSTNECRIHIRKSELELTMRIDHAVRLSIRQFVKSNVQGGKSKTECGMLMTCGP